jgi:uncharacterized protein (DUF3084 family)
MDTTDVIIRLRQDNDDLELEISARLEAVREAARRVELLERKARIEDEAEQLAQRMRDIEQGKQKKLVCRRGYWEVLNF